MIKIHQDSDEIFEKLYQYGIESDFSSFNVGLMEQMIEHFVKQEKYEYCKILKDFIDGKSKNIT